MQVGFVGTSGWLCKFTIEWGPVHRKPSGFIPLGGHLTSVRGSDSLVARVCERKELSLVPFHTSLPQFTLECRLVAKDRSVDT